MQKEYFKRLIKRYAQEYECIKKTFIYIKAPLCTKTTFISRRLKPIKKNLRAGLDIGTIIPYVIAVKLKEYPINGEVMYYNKEKGYFPI